MKNALTEIHFDSRAHGEVRDLTKAVQAAVAKSGVTEGMACVFAVGSTLAITTIECESGLIEDLQAALARIAPEGIPYAHDARWGDGNGHSHVRASLLGPSVAVPVADGELTCGTWQQIVSIDMDVRERSRTVLVRVMGD